jgi:hypothetical protein
MFATVDGKSVTIGDVVCFKSDVEQCGTIIKIKRTLMGSPVLVLQSTYGFQGDYIGGQEVTQELASDCWVE